MTRPVVTAAETDAALVEAARSGDVASYGLLVERYQPVAHRTAFALGAGDDTADVVQEAFVKAYLALDRFQVTEPFRPWLLRIVVNETRNRWRWMSRHRTVPLPLVGDDLTSAVPAPEQVAEDRETSRLLRDAWSRCRRISTRWWCAGICWTCPSGTPHRSSRFPAAL